jgi:hypothetical protein
MDIGPPRLIIEVEPVDLPVPETIPEPEFVPEPAREPAPEPVSPERRSDTKRLTPAP